MSSDPLRIVHDWLAAVNAGDVQGVLARTAPDVVIVGPRGTARGHEVLRAWLGHAGATFQTRETFGAGDAVVVAQHGVWRDVPTGEVRGEADVATRFRIDGERVAEMERYDDLHAALHAAGLTAADRQAESS
ncbi:nuclear transport factor 2 family protein [Longimicrobium sp.]|uniref:nuclear transport factor 2 family protein n=1 Tax=Longimicrobium sp. TaxID=2029185 RepID=UPI003B3B4C4E